MILQRIVGLAGVVLLAAAGWGQTLPAADLARVVRDLGSSQFAQREAAQQELGKIPPSQVETLRALAKNATDDEVKSRLEMRVREMETWNLLHPPGISLHLTNATLKEVGAALGSQLGPTVRVETSDTPYMPTDMRPAARAARRAARDAAATTPAKATLPAAPPPKFTIHTENAPFWKVFDLLHRQSPLYIDNTGVLSEGCINGIRLCPLQEGAKPVVYTVVDTVAYSAEIYGSRGGKLQVRVNINIDPRLFFARSTNIDVVKKFTNQAGVNLPYQSREYSYIAPLPYCSWNSVLDFDDVPGLRRIQELRGSTTVSLVAHRQETVYDLSAPVAPAPLKTPRGPFTLIKEGGLWRFEINGPLQEIATLVKQPAIIVRGYDEKGDFAGFYPGNTDRDSTRYPVRNQARKLQVMWADKMLDFEIPIEIKDLDIPDEPQPILIGSS